MKHQQTNKEDYVFGIRAVTEAIRFGKEIDKVLIKSGLQGELFKELWTEIKQNNIPYQYVPQEKLNRITLKNHQGVIALVSPISFSPYEDVIAGIFESGQVPFLVALDEVSDVRNFGAIVRSAECAGVHAVIIPHKGSARIGADAVKTSAGALLKVPVCRTDNLKKTLQYLQNSGIKLVAATEKASDLYYQASFNQPVCLVMGSEDTGISDEVLRLSDDLVKIPMQGEIGSLNVSAAASILLFEAVRQRLSEI